MNLLKFYKLGKVFFFLLFSLISETRTILMIFVHCQAYFDYKKIHNLLDRMFTQQKKKNN